MKLVIIASVLALAIGYVVAPSPLKGVDDGLNTATLGAHDKVLNEASDQLINNNEGKDGQKEYYFKAENLPLHWMNMAWQMKRFAHWVMRKPFNEPMPHPEQHEMLMGLWRSFLRRSGIQWVINQIKGQHEMHGDKVGKAASSLSRSASDLSSTAQGHLQGHADRLKGGLNDLRDQAGDHLNTLRGHGENASNQLNDHLSRAGETLSSPTKMAQLGDQTLANGINTTADAVGSGRDAITSTTSTLGSKMSSMFNRSTSTVKSTAEQSRQRAGGALEQTTQAFKESQTADALLKATGRKQPQVDLPENPSAGSLNERYQQKMAAAQGGN